MIKLIRAIGEIRPVVQLYAFDGINCLNITRDFPIKFLITRDGGYFC